MFYKTAISLLVLMAVLAMFISPVADLPRTALRGSTAAQTILLSLAIVAGLIVEFLSADKQPATGKEYFVILFVPLLSPAKLKTVFLC
jgi:heme A synthase